MKTAQCEMKDCKAVRPLAEMRHIRDGRYRCKGHGKVGFASQVEREQAAKRAAEARWKRARPR